MRIQSLLALSQDIQTMHLLHHFYGLAIKCFSLEHEDLDWFKLRLIWKVSQQASFESQSSDFSLVFSKSSLPQSTLDF